jgi:hypothetical protein
VKAFNNNYLIKTAVLSKFLKTAFANIANSREIRPLKSKIL